MARNEGRPIRENKLPANLGGRLWRRAGRWRQFAAASLLGAIFAADASGAGAEPLCPNSGGEKGLAIAVDERLDLTLEDGRTLKIAGIEPTRPTPSNPDLDLAGRDRLALWLHGLRIEFSPIGPGRDRWGRIAALVFAPPPELPEGQAQLAVGEAILDAGLGRYEPTSLAGLCRERFLAAEARARASGLGLWADPYYAVIAAGSRNSLAERTGSSVIAEGRVSGLSVRKPRITLYLGPRKGSDIPVTMVPASSKEFGAVQARLADMSGKTIRVRGLLDERFGPQIEMFSLDALEVLGEVPQAAAPWPGE